MLVFSIITKKVVDVSVAAAKSRSDGLFVERLDFNLVEVKAWL